MDSLSAAPEDRFSNRVADYVRYRPGYPAGILDWLREEAALSPVSVIADVGSGTGISSSLFLDQGCVVHGVEPNREMRQAAERLLAQRPAFHSVPGTAQATTLASQSMDFVVAAQAFHWFPAEETRAEFTRILKPGGWVVLLWNERRLDTTPFLRGYEELLLRFGTDYAAVRHEHIQAAELSGFFLGPYRQRSFPNQQRFDYAGLQGRLLSSSYTPAAGHPQHAPMLAGLRRLFDDHQANGEVIFDYLTQVYLGH